MMSQLTWSALLLAALAALAYFRSDDKPVCDEVRPIVGARACCERHRVAALATLTSVAEFEAVRRTEVDTLNPLWMGAGLPQAR
jgi:hypothetical protein